MKIIYNYDKIVSLMGFFGTYICVRFIATDDNIFTSI